ncbi:MAG: response regulator [Burkholderiaceae bacterium]|nr:response regulator [Burkholderiaceae bacterium]
MQKLLVVEDQADIRSLIRATLEYEAYELHEAEDGARGLHLARALRPALMLLDVMMPGELDGIQVCERLKKDPATAAIKIVLLTARGQKADVQVGQAAGCDAYLIKPFSPLQLIDTIEQLLAAPQGAAAR